MKKLTLVLLLLLLITLPASAQTNQSALAYIKNNHSPKPEGPYSQAITIELGSGKLIFVSGQISRDPMTNQLHEENIEIATRQTLNNIKGILKAAGSDMKNIIRADIFLKDMRDWTGMNAEYAKHFPKDCFPARQTVQVVMENRVEISCIAFLPKKN